MDVFIDTDPKIYINILACSYSSDFKNFDIIFNKRFELSNLKLLDDFDLSDYKLSANLLFGEYQKSTSKFKEFRINKSVTFAKNVLISLIKERFNELGYSAHRLRTDITFTFENQSFIQQVCTGFLNKYCKCFRFPTIFNGGNLNYTIKNTSKQWKTLVAKWIPDTVSMTTYV